MLTKRPDIVIALPPKRSRRRKVRAVAILTSWIVDRRPRPLTEQEIARRADAADREIQQNISPAQPSKPRGKR